MTSYEEKYNSKFKFKTDHSRFKLFHRKGNLVLTKKDSAVKRPVEKIFVVDHPLYLNDRFYSNRTDVVVSQPSAIISAGDVFIDFKPEQMDSDKEKGMINRLYNLEYGIKKIILTRGGDILERETNYLLLLGMIKRGYLGEEPVRGPYQGENTYSHMEIIDFHNLDSILHNEKTNLHNFSALVSQVEYASKMVHDNESKINVLSYLLNSLRMDTRPDFMSEETSLDELINNLSNLKIRDYTENKRKIKGENDRYLLESSFSKEAGNSEEDKRNRVKERLKGLAGYLDTFKEELKKELNDFPEQGYYLTVKSQGNIVMRLRDLNVKLNVKSGRLHEEGEAGATENPRENTRKIYLEAGKDKDVYVKYV